MIFVMKARRGGRCPACGKGIKKGEDISPLPSRQGFGHTACAKGNVPAQAKGTAQKGSKDSSTTSSTTEEMPEKFQNFSPSPYQVGIRDAFRTETAHLVIDAKAGSGKTSTIEWLLWCCQPRSCAFLAFNKSIANELAKRLPASVYVSTVHSLGLRALKNAYGGKVRPDTTKLDRILESMFPTRGVDKETRARNFPIHAPLRKLVGLHKATLSDDSHWLIDRYGIELNGASERLNEMVRAIPSILETCRLQAKNQGIVDYDDMIWLPVVERLSPQVFSTVFVDETQDLNRAQVELALLATGKGRIVAVGDPYQSIYGFRGADTEAMPNLISRLRGTERGCKVLPLSICYRCPTDVIMAAQHYVRDIEASPTAKSGEMWTIPAEADWYSNLTEESTMVLGRTNASVAGPALKAIRAGKKACIRGRDIGKGLVTFIKKMSKPGTDLGDFLKQLREYTEREVAKMVKAGKPIEGLVDREATLLALSEGLTVVEALVSRIEDIFSDDVEGAVFSTIHKSKGLEALRVYIVRPDLIPGPWAKTNWEAQQERNLAYVAVTRSMAGLIFVGTPKADISQLASKGILKSGSAEQAQAAVEAFISGKPLPSPPAPPRGPNKPTPIVPALSDRGDRGKAFAKQLQAKPEPEKPKLGVLNKLPEKLPTFPSTGDGFYREPTIQDWEAIRDAYINAGIPARLEVPSRWRMYALIVGSGENGEKVVRVGTTINYGRSGGGPRQKGSKAIHISTVEASKIASPPDGGAKKVLRKEGWQGRVCDRINSLLRACARKALA